jgi:hypothetical protein
MGIASLVSPNKFTYKLKPQNKFTMTIYSLDIYIYILEQNKQI